MNAGIYEKMRERERQLKQRAAEEMTKKTPYTVQPELVVMVHQEHKIFMAMVENTIVVCVLRDKGSTVIYIAVD